MNGTAMVLNEYRGYKGTVEYDHARNCMHGRIAQIRQKVPYTGETMEELEKAFHSTVDQYLAGCTHLGVQPENPYSGRMNIRVLPTTHRQIANFASTHRMRQNDLIDIALREFIRRNTPVETPEDDD